MKLKSKRRTAFYLATLFLLFSIQGINSQHNLTHLWTGLQSPQPESELPVGKAPFQKAIRKAKQDIQTILTPVEHSSGEWIISSGWELGNNTLLMESRQSIFDSDFDSGEWLNAIVPGTVLTTLVEQGIYPDPYYGLNNMFIPDTLCRMDWWYRNVFECPEIMHNEKLYLLFNGINYQAEVYLNGKKLGNINGAFIRGEFEITSLINKKGKNILAVHILPPNNPGIPHEQSMIAGQGLNGGVLSIDGATFISSMGWDWIPGIRDRNIGIWQDVRIKAVNQIKIIDPQVITKINLPDTTSAEISVFADVKNETDKNVEGKATIRIEDIEVEQAFFLAPFETKKLSFSPDNYPTLKIKNPRLWWPNGYGKQELYLLDMNVSNKQTISDSKRVRFGIREMSYELMVHDKIKGNTRIAYSPVKTIKDGKPLFDFENRKFFTEDNQLPTLQAGVSIADFEELDPNDPIGPFLVIKVNGTRIFCRGGNWGMDDAMKRSSRERLEPYLRLHKEMNFNTIRNWTGESTEETFYELCDEYGMLVWNDFWITTDDTVEPNDQAMFFRNATDAVRRFRNHPSIALWCPRNEGFAPEGLAKPLTEMLAKEDPTRHYHGQSRFLNMGTSGPWGYFEDPSRYYTFNAKGFNTEMGAFAIPTASTIRKFIAPEDIWPINDVWAYHDLHHKSQNFDGFMKTVYKYGEPQNMEEFSRQAQFVCYDAWRDMLEAWNSRMWNTTSGLILWMSHPAWPSMIWQTYTYDYETPGSYFGSKKACEPLHIQRTLPENNVIIVNTTRKDYKNLKATVSCFSPEGKELYKKVSNNLSIKANTKTETNLSFSKEGMPDLYLVRLELKDNKGKIVSVNDYWEAQTDSAHEYLNKLSTSDLVIKQKQSGKLIQVTIKNKSKRIAPIIKLNLIDKTTGEIILPAYFSDGYFNLLPSETKTITVNIDEINIKQDLSVVVNL